MFVVYRHRLQTQVLLFVDNVLEVVNPVDGIHLNGRCSCGEQGIERCTSRPEVLA
jgi:hypothetical protein